jgi:hypothetical protein
MIPAIVYGTVEDAIVNLSDEHSINGSHYLYVIKYWSRRQFLFQTISLRKKDP